MSYQRAEIKSKLPLLVVYELLLFQCFKSMRNAITTVLAVLFSKYQRYRQRAAGLYNINKKYDTNVTTQWPTKCCHCDREQMASV